MKIVTLFLVATCIGIVKSWAECGPDMRGMCETCAECRAADHSAICHTASQFCEDEGNGENCCCFHHLDEIPMPLQCCDCPYFEKAMAKYKKLMKVKASKEGKTGKKQ